LDFGVGKRLKKRLRETIPKIRTKLADTSLILLASLTKNLGLARNVLRLGILPDTHFTSVQPKGDSRNVRPAPLKSKPIPRIGGWCCFL
jgi:hypothetical protein